MKHQSMCLSVATFIFYFASLSASADLPDLAPPKVQLVDEFGVNVHSGQVQSSLDTVSIGGAMGLSHSISNYTNNFSIAGYRGYQDKYYAKARVTDIDTRIGRPYKNVLRVHDIGGSADFELIVGGVAVNFATSNPVYVANYSYRALGDGRNLLETRSDGVYWIKPDGTEVRFEKGNAGYPEQVGMLRQIKYPNGFTIDVDYLHKRVTTNTGFALKYIHRDATSADWAIDPSKLGVVAEIPAINPQLWLNSNPQFVQAINTAKDGTCFFTSGCTLSWPQAEFTWPTAMPRSIYIGDSTFKVTDAMGGVTEYYFRAFDLVYKDSIAGGPIAVDPNAIGRNFSPRLIGIKPASATQKVFQYTYKNIFQDNYANTNTGDVGSVWFTLSSEAGQVTRAQRYGEMTSYQIGEAYYSDIQNMGGGFIWRVLPKVDAYPGAINSVSTLDGVINYELSYRNFPLSYTKPSGSEDYEYDLRGNMKKVTKNGTWTAAEYPANCTATPRQYCNKPIWTSDAKGNKTEFTYHHPTGVGEEPSGEVRTITYPADKNGLVKVIRYEYAQHRAMYFQGNNYKEQGTPIWLKTEERTCAKSATVGNGCAVANDEIITKYKYESDNLYLTEMTVEAYDGNLQLTTKRICYEYDKYGNKIGETQPNANPSSCSRQ